MTTRLMFSAALIALMTSVAAAPLFADRGERPDFSALDADGDGEITQAEIQARGDARFAAADIDGSGSLTAEELAAQANRDLEGRAERRISRMISRHDTNGDGELSREEIGDGRAEKMLNRVDSDGDGAISREEFEAAGERHARHEGGRHGERHGDRPSGPPPRN